MTTWYIDYSIGSDKNLGTSWGSPFKTIDRAAQLGIASPGDIIKVAKSGSQNILPSGTHQAAWTNLNRLVTLNTSETQTIDLCENAWTGKTGIITVINSTPSAGGSGYKVGDYLIITTGGTGGVVRVLTIGAGGQVLSISLYSGGSGYTVGSGKLTSGGSGTGCTVSITTVASTTMSTYSAARKEGFYCESMVLPPNIPGWTLLGYRATGTLNLESYQKLSLWFRSNAIHSQGHYMMCLCNDVSGSSVQDSFYLPAYNGINRWVPFTITRNKGGNLGTAIKSIALYSDSTPFSSGRTFFIDDIIACKTDGLNLQSLISKNSLEQGGTEGWWAIKSIDNVNVYLDGETNSLPNSGNGYSGTTETVNTYYRETTKTSLTSSSTDYVQRCTVSGTSGSLISIKGGYNKTTDIQDGLTIFDGLNGYGYGFSIEGNDYIKLNNIGFARYNYGFYSTSMRYSEISISDSNNNTNTGVYIYYGSYNTFLEIGNCNSNLSHGIYIYGSSYNSITNIFNACSNEQNGFFIEGSYNLSIDYIGSTSNNTAVGIYFRGTNSTNININTINNSNYNGNNGINISSPNINIQTIRNANYNNVGIIIYGDGKGNFGDNCKIRTIEALNYNGVGLNSYQTNDLHIDTIYSSYTSSGGAIEFTNCGNSIIKNAFLSNNYIGVRDFGSFNSHILNLTSSSNSYKAISSLGWNLYIEKASISEPEENRFGIDAPSIYKNTRISITNLNSTGSGIIVSRGGTIIPQSSTTPGVKKEWKFNITDISRDINFPITMNIARIAVKENLPVTVALYFKKSHATNMGAYLLCKGGSLAGVDSDIQVFSPNDTNRNMVSLPSFTPEEAGVLELEAGVYSIDNSMPNGNVIIDSLIVLQE